MKILITNSGKTLLSGNPSKTCPVTILAGLAALFYLLAVWVAVDSDSLSSSEEEKAKLKSRAQERTEKKKARGLKRARQSGGVKRAPKVSKPDDPGDLCVWGCLCT